MISGIGRDDNGAEGWTGVGKVSDRVSEDKRLMRRGKCSSSIVAVRRILG